MGIILSWSRKGTLRVDALSGLKSTISIQYLPNSRFPEKDVQRGSGIRSPHLPDAVQALVAEGMLAD
jgi:hypothetical protein